MKVRTSVAPLAALAASLLLAMTRITHANAPAGRYVVASPDVVYDTKTKLTWQQSVIVTPSFSWGSPTEPGTAQNYCSALEVGALSGWRVPTVGELQTLVDYSKSGIAEDGGHAPMVDTTFFPDTPPGVFWSSTPYKDYPDFAWGVNFGFGNANGYQVLPLNYVRCVR
jgi:hypothetical protein